ncbi:MAG: UDP-N-acetylglucosamine 2-epimerase (non-hydrolyzing), partial [Candidatus Zixiibacteriota bacterium]
MSQTIALVIGARPNFMKAAPLLRELQKYPDRFSPVLIHTGQHYDANLSQLFFDELGLPEPDLYLGVG